MCHFMMVPTYRYFSDTQIYDALFKHLLKYNKALVRTSSGVNQGSSIDFRGNRLS